MRGIRLVVAAILSSGILAIAPAAALAPAVTLLPTAGPAGSEITVGVSDFTTLSTFEVHAGDFDGPLLGTGETDTAREGAIAVTIPPGTPAGALTIAVCEVEFVPCSDTNNEFWVGATASFTVTPPPTTATTSTIPVTLATLPPVTLPPVTLPPPVELPSSGACVIPSGAEVLDFDDLPTGSIDEFTRGALAVRGFVPWQYASETVAADGAHHGSGPMALPYVDILDRAARSGDIWLGSSSAPNILRFEDRAQFSVETALTGGRSFDMQYLGFNVGFGHYGEGFDRPDLVEFEVTVRLLPSTAADGALAEAFWEPISITIGPGPQRVEHCVMLANTAGPGLAGATWLVDVVPRTPDGATLHLLIEIDDLFYGPGAEAPATGCVIPEDALHIDFDEIPVSASGPDLKTYFSAIGLWPSQRTHETRLADGTIEKAETYVESGDMWIADRAGLRRDGDIFTYLGTSSPPHTLRIADDAHLQIETEAGSFFDSYHLGYIGFNLGFSHFSEGFDRPTSVAFDVAVTMRTIHDDAAGRVVSASWDPVTVTLGPGPQPVTTCVLIRNTAGAVPEDVAWSLDIIPRSPDGEPLHLIIEIDDLFYGAAGPIIPTIDLTEEVDRGFELPWGLAAALGAALALGGWVVFRMVRRRP